MIWKDDGFPAMPDLNESILLEFQVGASRGMYVNREVFSKATNGRQGLAAFQVSARDQPDQLLTNLFCKCGTGLRVNHDLECSMFHVPDPFSL